MGDIVVHKSSDGSEIIGRVIDVIEPSVSRSGVRGKITYKISTFKKPEIKSVDDDDLDDLIKKPDLIFTADSDEVSLLVTCK